MSRRRPLHKYPNSYFVLFERAQVAPVVLQMDSEAAARSARVELYTLRGQVRETVAADPTLHDLAEHLVLMENIEIRVRGNKVTLAKKLRNPLATAIQDAIYAKPTISRSGQ